MNKNLRECYVNGMAGKEEDASQARILSTPEPLPNEILPFRKLYIIGFVCLVLGIFIRFFWGAAFLVFIAAYCINVSVVDHKRDRLRRAKFAISPNVSNDALFEKLQPVLISKYNFLVERNTDGLCVVSHNNTMYDIGLESDNTFTIWWHFDIKNAVIPKNKYKSYRQMLADMGIIAYEIQNIFLVK